MEANSLVIRGGNVVAEDAILPNHDIVVEDGTIGAHCADACQCSHGRCAA